MRSAYEFTFFLFLFNGSIHKISLITHAKEYYSLKYPHLRIILKYLYMLTYLHMLIFVYVKYKPRIDCPQIFPWY